jgi:hypothetical protein
MDRRLVAVCSTAALLILAFFIDTSVAGTKRTTKATQPLGVRSRTQQSMRSNISRNGEVRSTKTCAPCAADLARNKKRQVIGKNIRAAKTLPCHPKNYIDPKIAGNYDAALKDMNRAGIKPQVTSAWRSKESQEQLYRCSMSARCRRANPGIYRALPPGESLHEAGFAVDMSGIAAGPRGGKRLTSKGRRIVGIMRKNGFKWRYGLADPAHFEADPRKHGYRTVKQAITKTRTTCQVNLAKNKALPNNKLRNRTVAGRTHGSPKEHLRAETASKGHSSRVGS